MKARLKRFLDSLNFTPTERTVVLVLAGAFVAGIGIRLLRQDPDRPPRFDYTASDAEFAGKSAARPVPRAAADSPDASVTDTGGKTGAPAETPRVNLNRATKRELMGLPGVGEVLAERILVYREEHGGFGNVNDLLKVRGIGRRKLEQIASHCVVGK